MGVKQVKRMYPMAECFEVESEGTTVIDLVTIPAGTLVEKVLVRIETAATGTANLLVGDDDDADGFVVASDATANAGTVYGDAVAEIGAYLKGATGATDGYCPLPGKFYAAEGKAIKFKLSAAPTTEGVFQVMVVGKRVAV